jgi:hypothetical protein
MSGYRCPECQGVFAEIDWIESEREFWGEDAKIAPVEYAKEHDAPDRMPWLGLYVYTCPKCEECIRAYALEEVR